MRSKLKRLLATHPVLLLSVPLLALAGMGTRFLLKGGVAELTLTPDRIDQCDSQNIEVQVSWYAPHHTTVNIYVSRLGAPPQLWVSAGGRGTEKTGAWITDGSSVMVMDEHGRMLARRTMTSVDCGPDSPQSGQVATLSEP